MKSKPSLILCIFMDIVGYLTYLLPIVGEWGDIIWAPISAFVFYKIFGGKTGKIGALISFAEEILPFIDFIPTFTIAYIYSRFKKE
jgi:hypothetical protein